MLPQSGVNQTYYYDQVLFFTNTHTHTWRIQTYYYYYHYYYYYYYYYYTLTSSTLLSCTPEPRGKSDPRRR